MGFRKIFRISRMRADSALTQALRSRWDAKATAFVFPWGHMIPNLEDVIRITGLRVYGRLVSGYTYPCYHDLAQRLLELPVERRSSLVPRVPLQESLGLFDVGKGAGESEDEHLDRLVRVSQRELANNSGAQADLDLRRFLVLFLGRLLFATRGDAVHCRFLPLLEELSEVGGYAWGAAFLAHQFDSMGASERQTSTSGFFPFFQVWAYLHLPALGRGDLTRPGLVPIARRWDSRRDSLNLEDQLERLQEAIDSYPYLDARPYFGRSVWLHALNLVLPLHLYLSQRSLGLRQSAVEFPFRDQYRRPSRSFRGLHDTTDWHERAKEQIDNWERRGKAVKLDATTDDAYLQVYALKYGGKVYKSVRHQVDVVGEVASLRALLYSAVQDREAAQRQTAELRRELERVRSTRAGGASSSQAAGGSPSLLEAQLAGAVLRAEEAQRHLEERKRDLWLTTEHAMDLQGERDQLQGEVQTTRSERNQLRIRAEAAEAQVAEATKELAALRVQRSPEDQEEVTRLRAELLAQQAVAWSLQQIVTDIGRSRSKSRSRASVSRATGTSVGQYLAGSSSRQRNEEEERRRQGEGSAQSGRGGGEMPPPPDRQEGSEESGDPALTQALRSRWDTEAMAFVFPWGHMIPSLEDVSRITGLRVYGRPVSGFTYPCYHDIAERLLELPVERRSSLIPRKALQQSLGLYDVARQTGDDANEHLEQLVRGSQRELASEPGPQADLDLRRFLILFLGRLLFATRGDAVHCRFLPLLEDLSEVGGYAWGAAFLAHQFDSLGTSERQTSTSGFYPFLQVWAYLHLPGLGRGVLEQPGLVPIARRWDSPRDYRSLGDQLTRLQKMIDSYPHLDVVWQPYLEEGDEGQPQLVQAHPYFGRSVWLHALNLVLPLNLFLCQRSLGLRQSVVEFSTQDQFRRPGRSFRGLHDTTDWRMRAQEQINN
ncbi:hypothetical protein Taro_041015 [Colocasia esculenta]|uniref:Aminotransferase-like plant mobile domain-containing protein n=1 Tax=Colocasia esculenta TaxID=4460 RepID=A0A843WZM1_COLES|nr:hypothetical protein [Colocasia esculenta]